MGAGFRRQAYAHQLSPVLILTHPQEYMKKTDFRYAILDGRIDDVEAPLPIRFTQCMRVVNMRTGRPAPQAE
jgi:hypothetical protein